MKRRKRIGCAILAASMFFVSGCTSLLGEYDYSFVEDDLKELSSMTYEEMTVNIDYHADESLGINKYESQYPNAFKMLAQNHAVDPDHMIYFQILDYKEPSTIIYAYQTMELTSVNQGNSEIVEKENIDTQSGIFEYSVGENKEEIRTNNIVHSVVMQYNMDTKETKVFWEEQKTVNLTDGLEKPEVSSLYAYPITNIRANNKVENNGYMVFYDDTVILINKDGTQDSCVDLSKEIQSVFQEYKSKDAGVNPTYDIGGISVSGTIDQEFYVQIDLLINNKTIKESDMDADSEDADEFVDEYTIYICMKHVDNQTINIKNTNVDNQVKEFKSDENSKLSNWDGYVAALNKYPTSLEKPCFLIGKDKYMIEVMNNKGEILQHPICRTSNPGTFYDMDPSQGYFVKLNGNGDSFYFSGKMSLVQTNTRVETGTHTDGNYGMKFSESYSYSLSDARVVTFRVEEGHKEYKSFANNYLISIDDKKFTVVSHDNYQNPKSFKEECSAKTEEDIVNLDTRLIAGTMYITIDDGEYVYIYRCNRESGKMKLNLEQKVDANNLYFKKTTTFDLNQLNSQNEWNASTDILSDEAELTSEERQNIDAYSGDTIHTGAASGVDDEIKNPDLYKGINFIKINSDWYICSVNNGLVKISAGGDITQISPYSCYTMLPCKGSYLVLAYDNENGIYLDLDIVQSKHLTYQQMTNTEK